MMRLFMLSLMLFCASQVFSQTSEIARRHNFASSYFGLDAQVFPFTQQGFELNDANEVNIYNRNGFVIPSINIGATHFWGYADFYITIGTTPISFRKDSIENSYQYGVITGLRVYPLAPQKYPIRPFLGYKFTPFRFQQVNTEGEVYNNTTVRSALEAGLGYQSASWYLYLSGNMILQPEEESWLSRTVVQPIQQPTYFFSLGANYRLETTRGAYSPSVRILDTLLRQQNAMGLFFGIGPSSAFPTANSSSIIESLPFLDDRAMPDLFPDISAGYHFSRQEWVVAAAFRPMRQTRTAYGFQQQVNRNSFALESYKFLFDYHGFAPFIGAGVMWDNMRLSETDNDVNITETVSSKLAPGLVFGWDIRPGKRADPWLLRTNLRYSPYASLEKDNATLSLQYLEFNFIQFVLYPQRLSYYRNL